VFIDSPLFRHREKDIYGGARLVMHSLFCKPFHLIVINQSSITYCVSDLVPLLFVFVGYSETHGFIMQSGC
jgi:hypothetical protein